LEKFDRLEKLERIGNDDEKEASMTNTGENPYPSRLQIYIREYLSTRPPSATDASIENVGNGQMSLMS